MIKNVILQIIVYGLFCETMDQTGTDPPEHPGTSKTMSNKLNPRDKCEECKTADIWHHNETVRDKKTGTAKIMDICKKCFEKITGAK